MPLEAAAWGDRVAQLEALVAELRSQLSHTSTLAQQQAQEREQLAGQLQDSFQERQQLQRQVQDLQGPTGAAASRLEAGEEVEALRRDVESLMREVEGLREALGSRARAQEEAEAGAAAARKEAEAARKAAQEALASAEQQRGADSSEAALKAMRAVK